MVRTDKTSREGTVKLKFKHVKTKLMALEEEVYELLKEFCNRWLGFTVKRKPKLEGYSGFVWEPDFILERDGDIVLIIEVKDIHSKEESTLWTQMRLAFAELCDLHRQYQEAHTLVILSDEAFTIHFDKVDKYQRLFSSVAGGIVPKDYILAEDGLNLELELVPT